MGKKFSLDINSFPSLFAAEIDVDVTAGFKVVLLQSRLRGQQIHRDFHSNVIE